MSPTILSTCGHQLSPLHCDQILQKQPLEICVDCSVKDAFAQLTEQFRLLNVTCPVCDQRLRGITKLPSSSARFPLSNETFAHLKFPTLQVDLKNPAQPDHIIFQRVELNNILNGGKHARDAGQSYAALAELANDYAGLLSMLGPVLGRLLYILPTAWKAKVFIDDMLHSDQLGLANCSWIMRSAAGKTIGLISLDAIERQKFAMDDRPDLDKLFNVGVLLHSDFQRRGVVTTVTEHLYDALGSLDLDMDGLWIRTRPDNEAVNHIAERLGFSFYKTMTVMESGLIPCFGATAMPQNLYYKRFDRS